MAKPIPHKPDCDYCKDLSYTYIQAFKVPDNVKAHCMMCPKGVNMFYDRKIAELNKERLKRLTVIITA